MKQPNNISFFEPLENPPSYKMEKEGDTLEVTLDVQYEENEVFSFDKENHIKAKTRVFSSEKTRKSGRTIVGPTIEIRRNSKLIINSNNNLPAVPEDTPKTINFPHGFNTYNIHTHGLHVDPKSPADNVCMSIYPGQKYTNIYDIPDNHPFGSYWYHPHKHGSVAIQVGSGMAGLIIMRGEFDDIVEKMGIKEYCLVFQNIALDSEGKVESHDQVSRFPNSEYNITTNGQFCPIISCDPGEVINLRFLNATTRSGLQFKFPAHAELFAYSVDGNPFDDYRESQGVALPPGGRQSAFLKVNEMATPGEYYYIYNDVKEYQQVTGMTWNNNVPLFILAINGPKPKTGQWSSDSLAKANVVPPCPKEIFKSDILKPITDDEITNTRKLTLQANKGNKDEFFGGLNVAIDHLPFQGCAHVNHTVKLNAVEEWELVNNSYFPHPIHIHVNPCYITEVKGEQLLSLTPKEPYWADTFFVPAKGSLKFRSRFTDFTGKYPIHCHILYHEDGGMMQHVEVVE